MKFYNAPIKYICVENPIPSSVYEMPKPTQTIQPYEYYGELHPWTKKTCLWLKGLPSLVPVEAVPPQGPYCPSGTSANKGIVRNRGAAKRGEDAKIEPKHSMASQWRWQNNGMNSSKEKIINKI